MGITDEHVARIASEAGAEVAFGVIALHMFRVEPSQALVKTMVDRAVNDAVSRFYQEFDPLDLAPSLEQQKYRNAVSSSFGVRHDV